MQDLISKLNENELYGILDRLKRNVISYEEALAEFESAQKTIVYSEPIYYTPDENLIFGYTHDEIARMQGIAKLRK